MKSESQIRRRLNKIMKSCNAGDTNLNTLSKLEQITTLLWVLKK